MTSPHKQKDFTNALQELSSNLNNARTEKKWKTTK